MKYKVLALDLDGTLTNSEKVVSSYTRSVLDRAQDAGVVVLLVSGRPTPGVQWVAKMLDFHERNGYIIAYNGSEVVKGATGEKVFDFHVDSQYIPYLYDKAIEYGVQLAMYYDGAIWCENPDWKWTRIESELNHMPCRKVDNLLEEFKWPTPKCMLLGEPEVLARLEGVLVEALGDKLGIFRSEPFFLEIMPNQLNKAKSIDMLLNRLGISREELIACGDGYNDVHMVEYAGLGVAMDNACEPVKQVADFITKSNDEDGVAYVVEKFMLGTVE